MPASPPACPSSVTDASPFERRSERTAEDVPMDVVPGYSSSPPVKNMYLYVRPVSRSAALTSRLTRTVCGFPPEASGISASVIR